MDLDSEDEDAKEAGTMTQCGLPAAMDSASAPKATSPMKSRSRRLQKKDPEKDPQDHQLK